MKETCSNCRFGHTLAFESETGPMMNTFCREDKPSFIPPNSSGLLPVNPDGWCGKWQFPILQPDAVPAPNDAPNPASFPDLSVPKRRKRDYPSKL